MVGTGSRPHRDEISVIMLRGFKISIKKYIYVHCNICKMVFVDRTVDNDTLFMGNNCRFFGKSSKVWIFGFDVVIVLHKK